MISRKKNRHTEEELKVFFNEKNIDKKYFFKFLDNYKICFDELFEEHKDWKDDEFENGDSVQDMALDVAMMRLVVFLEEIAKGHGEEWAQIIVDQSEEGERAIYFSYHNLIKKNYELAKKELLIHCKTLGEDEYFEKYYLYLFEIQTDIIGRVEKALDCSDIFKNELVNGKSKEYAHQCALICANRNY